MAKSRTVCFGAILIAGAITLHSQVASRINGVVTDNTGATIPRASVLLTEVRTGVTRSGVTNEAGRYSFPNLLVGHYTVTAEMKGFKKAVTEVLKLDVNQVIDVDLRLELGEMTQQIEVSADATLLQTSDSQVGALVENKLINDLPLAARDFMQLSLLSPGVVESRDNIRHQTSRGTWQGSFSVHGQSGKYNQYIFDGLVGKEVQHQTNIFAPSIDAIQEIRIQTSNYSAEFGGEAGGHINVVTKAGTNEFHGTAFEFLRNTKFNAREKFADRRAQLNRNTFGATLGGPIRKDKTFVFGAWDSMRIRQGFTQNTTVPTPALRNGDFSSLLTTDSSNARPIVLYDWTNNTPFAGNILPPARLSPLALRFQQEFIPLANRAGRGGVRPIDNYQSLEPQETRNDQYITRLDHHFNPANRIYGRYIISSTDTLAAPPWPAFSYRFKMRGQHAALNYTRTLDPATVYEFRTGYSRFRQNDLTESAFRRNTAAELGLRNACPDPQCWHAPLFQITDFSSWGTPAGRNQASTTEGPRGWKNEIFQIHTGFYLTRGNHIIKVGFTGFRHRDTFPNGLQPAGVHTFNGQWTAGADSNGFALADTLLGLPRRIRASVDIVDPNFRNSHVMPWAQDDWKITRRLTLNLGLRYEWFGRPQANRDTIGNFFIKPPGQAVIITPRGPATPLTEPRPDSLGRSLLQNDNNNFAPRIGFAFQANDRTVFRGAYGIFFQRDTMDYWILQAFNPPFVRTGDVTLNVGAQSIRDFPVDDLGPVVNFVRPGSRPAPYGRNVDWKEAYVQQWNLYIERSVTRNLVAKIGYVGNKGTGIPRDFFPNEGPPAAGDIQARRPYQNLSTVLIRNSDGQGTYHGLELFVEQRFGRGLSFVSSYTFSKTLDNRGFLDIWFGGNNKSRSSLNVSHRLSYSGIWDIPFGRSRKWGSMNRFADAVLGGWQLGGILVVRTGFPLTPGNGVLGDIANAGGVTQVPNRIAGINLGRGERTENRFFNTAALAAPARFTLGNAGLNSIDGPNFWNLDTSIMKIFRVTESKMIQLRGEFFNFLNHPNWGDPGTGFGTATLGRITSTSGEPRNAQIALKFIF
ncbi:MAG: carboxypeptidase regulatory-like domain-containing protein [Bryobacteraceae bacterium]